MIKKEQMAEAFIRKHAQTRYEHIVMKVHKGLYPAVAGGLKPAGWEIYEGPRSIGDDYVFKAKKKVGGVTDQERLMSELSDLLTQINKLEGQKQDLITQTEEVNIKKTDLIQRVQLMRKQCKHTDNGDGKCTQCGHVLYVKDFVNVD